MLVYKTYQECFILLTLYSCAVVSLPVTGTHTSGLAGGDADAEESTHEEAVHRPATRNVNQADIPIPNKLKKTISESVIPQGSHVSSLAYRKTFQIHFPLKPKLFKHIHYLHKKNLAAKRDTKNSSYFQRKHVPFIKSFTMLLGDALRVGEDITNTKRSEESFAPIPGVKPNKLDIKNIPELIKPESANFIKSELKGIHHHKGKYYSKKGKKTTDTENTKFEIASDPKDAETTTTSIITIEDGSFNITTDDTSSSISLSPETNSTRSGGDDDRHTHGSSSTNNTNDKGVFSKYSRYAERISSNHTPASISEGFSEYSNSTSRNGTDGSFTGPGRRGQTGNGITRLDSRKGNGDDTKIDSSERSSTLRDLIEQLKIKNKIKDRRDSTQVNGKGFGSRLRGCSVATEEIHARESIQPGSVTGKSIQSNSKADPDYQRNTNRNGRISHNTTIVQKVDKINSSSSNITSIVPQSTRHSDNDNDRNKVVTQEIIKPNETSHEQVYRENNNDITTVFPQLKENYNENETVSPESKIFSSEVENTTNENFAFSLDNVAKIMAPWSKPVEIVSGYSNYNVVDSKTKL